METPTILYLIAATVFSGLISFVMTPPVRALAKRIGAVDIPSDSRRMHTVPIPRLGGLAIFLGFMLASWLFATMDKTLLAIWLGGLIIVAMGIIDDVFRLHPIIKFLIQIAAALTVCAQGLRIEFLHIGNYYIIFDPRLSIAITLLWIVGLTNAMNLIDGLDGLSGGIAAIASLSLTVLSFLRGDTGSALLTAILFGACVGFLPFNHYPAKIFLGDTGSQFLGFLLAVLTLSGLFKMHAVISFFVPVVIFALPLFDTTFAFFRRLFKGKNPFKGDRGHLHHRLMDLGYSQKETVSVLHAICGLLGISAVLFSLEIGTKAIWALASGAIVLFLYLCLLHPTKEERAALKKSAMPPAVPPTLLKPEPETEPEIESEIKSREAIFPLPSEQKAKPNEQAVPRPEQIASKPSAVPMLLYEEPEPQPEPIDDETFVSSPSENDAAIAMEPDTEAETEIETEAEAEEAEELDEEESLILAQLERLLMKKETESATPTEEVPSVPGPVILDEICTPTQDNEPPAPAQPETEPIPIVQPHCLQEEDGDAKEYDDTTETQSPEGYLSFDGTEEQIPRRHRPRPSRTIPGGKK